MGKKHTSRQHHYLPQGYLSAFTNTGLKDGQFFVLETNSSRSFRTSPKNVVAERDFNRIDIEGMPPDALENALAPFEEQAIRAIRNVLESEEFPTDEDCNWILNLLGLIAVRNPQRRNSFNSSREHTIKVIADLLVSDKKIFDHNLAKAREAGEITCDDVSFEDMKRFIKEQDYSIEFPVQDNLRIELQMFDKLLPILGQRTWSILVAPKDGPEFICSDHPVTLIWKTQQNATLGFALRETEVFFPLGRKIGFYGVFEDTLIPLVNLTPTHVGKMNMRVALNAERYVFSALPSFVIWHKGKLQEVNCEPNTPSNRRDV